MKLFFAALTVILALCNAAPVSDSNFCDISVVMKRGSCACYVADIYGYFRGKEREACTALYGQDLIKLKPSCDNYEVNGKIDVAQLSADAKRALKECITLPKITRTAFVKTDRSVFNYMLTITGRQTGQQNPFCSNEQLLNRAKCMCYYADSLGLLVGPTKTLCEKEFGNVAALKSTCDAYVTGGQIDYLKLLTDIARTGMECVPAPPVTRVLSHKMYRRAISNVMRSS